MKRYVLLFAGLLAAMATEAQTFTVAAAANLSAVEQPLKAAFAKTHPGMSLQFTFAASGTLVTQILHGAPYQVFLSADRAYPQKLVDAKLAKGPVKTYALGRLVFLSTTPLKPAQGLEVLLEPRVSQFAVANPETAPYGRAALEVLKNAGWYDRVAAKQVTAQNITQAVQFTLATGFGFVNKSAVLAEDLKAYSAEGQYWFEVDPSLYSPIEQGLVVLSPLEGTPEGQALVDFFLSADAQKIFAAFGYGRP